MTKRTLSGLLAATLLLFGAGCGDDDSSSADDETSQDGGTSNDGGSTDNSIEDLSDAVDELQGVGGQLGECATIGASYAALGLAAIGGDASQDEVDGLLQDLADSIPSELEEPFSVVASAYRELADEGVLSGSDALDSTEFEDANAEIEAWVEENCAGLGG